jgi:hypothetical protein
MAHNWHKRIARKPRKTLVFRLMGSPSASRQALLPQAGKAVKAQREANRCLAGLIVESVL